MSFRPRYMTEEERKSMRRTVLITFGIGFLLVTLYYLTKWGVIKL